MPNQRLHRHNLRSKMQLIQLLNKLVTIPEDFRNREESTKSTSNNLNQGNNKQYFNEEEDRHFSSRVKVQPESSELSIMASIKQVKGNTGTLFTLMHYSQADATYHR